MKPILMEALDIHGMFAMFASKIFKKLPDHEDLNALIYFSLCVQRYNSYTLLHTEKQNNIKLKFNLFY